MANNKKMMSPELETIVGSSVDRTIVELPPASPNLQGNNNNKAKKHTKHAGRAHIRNLSGKGIHNPESGNRKPVRNASTTSIKKNNSHVNLRRNRSSAEVKPKVTVAFEIAEHEDGWEETSSSTSPAISRSNSKATSKSQTPIRSKASSRSQAVNKDILCDSSTNTNSNKASNLSDSTQSRMVAQRLLSRSQTQYATTHMSHATATLSVVNIHSSPSSPKKNSSLNTQEALRLLADSETQPSSSSQLLSNRAASSKLADDLKRVKSMANLAYPTPDEDENSVLAFSQQFWAGQSRTQQKLWLQRASSIIVPKQMPAYRGGEIGLLASSSLEGQDPGVKNLLARTGAEYLGVRRYQDPVNNALKRVSQILGIERSRNSLSKSKKSTDGTTPNNSSNGQQHNSKGQNPRGHKQGKSLTISNPVSRGHKTGFSPSSLDAREYTQNESYDTCNNDSLDTGNEDVHAILRKLWNATPTKLSSRS